MVTQSSPTSVWFDDGESGEFEDGSSDAGVNVGGSNGRANSTSAAESKTDGL